MAYIGLGERIVFQETIIGCCTKESQEALTNCPGAYRNHVEVKIAELVQFAPVLFVIEQMGGEVKTADTSPKAVHGERSREASMLASSSH